MVSEPKAAAVYTARYLSKDKKKEFLKASLFAQLRRFVSNSTAESLRRVGARNGWIVQLIACM
jgi:hypothetical protein